MNGVNNKEVPQRVISLVAWVNSFSYKYLIPCKKIGLLVIDILYLEIIIVLRLLPGPDLEHKMVKGILESSYVFPPFSLIPSWYKSWK